MLRQDTWPIFVIDRKNHHIYLTQERWDHALDHPGMSDTLLNKVLQTLNKGTRKQDPYDPAKFKYVHRFFGLPMDYTHIVVVVKFGWQATPPYKENNFVLTAYMVERRR